MNSQAPSSNSQVSFGRWTLGLEGCLSPGQTGKEQGMSVAIGAKAPDFTLPNQDREPVTLSEQLKKGPVVLAFMPAAFSGTCTAEMCAFRDSAAELNKVNATVLGVTVDTFFALKAWADAQSLKIGRAH